MADVKTYDVHRAMLGDGREYAVGDTRELTEIDAKDLVASGALALQGEEPATRPPAVTHTFGKAEPTGHLSTTTATTDEAMTRGRKSAAVTLPVEKA